MRSVTDRTGQAQLTSKQTPLNTCRERQGSTGVGRTLRKSRLTRPKLPKTRGTSTTYSTNRGPDLSRPEEDFRRAQSPQSPKPTQVGLRSPKKRLGTYRPGLAEDSSSRESRQHTPERECHPGRSQKDGSTTAPQNGRITRQKGRATSAKPPSHLK